MGHSIEAGFIYHIITFITCYYEIVKLQRNAVYCDGHPSKHWPPLTLLNFNNIIIVLIFIEFFIIAVFYFVTFCNNSKKFVFLFKRAIYKLIHLYFCWPAWPGKNATQNTIYKAISIKITKVMDK
jgi:hypothetical protein